MSNNSSNLVDLVNRNDFNCLISENNSLNNLDNIDDSDSDDLFNLDIVINNTCRICLEDDTDEELIHPCKCKGTSYFIHNSCLTKWRLSHPRSHHNFKKCELCKYKFKYYSNKKTFFPLYEYSVLKRIVTVTAVKYP